MIPGNSLESSQNILHCMGNTFLLKYLKEWILVGYPVTEGTLLGSFLP